MVHTVDNPIIIKKYANRRLYNTDTSSYITLEDLCSMVKQREYFVVQDAKTGEDLTRFILTQIIFEQESKGYNILPENFLRQLICFYDDNLASVLAQYLDSTMNMFTSHQEQFRDYIPGTFEAFNPVKNFEEVAEKNKQIFDNAMKTFTHFQQAFTPKDNKDNDKDD